MDVDTTGPEAATADSGNAAPPRANTRRGGARRALASWNWRTHPPAWATLNLAAAILWTTWAGWKLGAPPTVALIGGAIGALGAAAAAMISEQPAPVIAWRITCWAIPAVWATAALHWSPWQPVILVGGAATAVVMGVIAAAIRRARKTARDAALERAARGTGLSGHTLAAAPADQVWNAADPDATSREALAANWEARISRVCGIKGVRVTDIGLWSQGTGYTLLVDLPRGGVSWRRLADHAEGLAEDAELPPDCGVTVKGSPRRRGLAEVQVMHRNMLRETHPAAPDYSPTSIYQPMRLFTLPDGTRFKVLLKWVWMSVTGQTGSGKSSLMHLLNLGLGRCTDVIVWHIDVGGGGGMSRPWITPWHEGRAERPVVDWAATTDAEAALMCCAALAIIKGRKKHYAGILDNGKVPASAEVPHIVVISDETATLPERVKESLEEICQTGRGASVRGITSALRGTAGDLPRNIKQHSRVKIAMRVDDPDEVRYLFDRPGKVDLELAQDEGSGWVEQQDEDETGRPIGRKVLTPAKADFMSDDRVDEAAVALAPLRPALDPVSVALANSVTADRRAYTDRWARTLPELFADTDNDEEPEGPVEGDPERAARIRDAEARQAERHRDGGTVAERLDRLSALRDDILNTQPAEPEPAAGVDPDAWDALTGGMGMVDNLADVLAAVDGAGPDGIGPADILQRVNTRRAGPDHITKKTIQRKLEELVDTGAVIRTGRGVYVSAIHHQGGPDDR